jgi:beta-aspartyl-peptidase (threonine type)
MASDKVTLLPSTTTTSNGDVVLVIHGGAGTMRRSSSTPAQQARYKAALAQALIAGHAILSADGEAMDAAVAAVSVLEGLPFYINTLLH